MKFKLWKCDQGKWYSFSETFNDADTEALHYQKAARLIVTRGWAAYPDLPPVKRRVEGRMIETAVIVPLMAEPLELSCLDWSNLEKIMIAENSERDLAGKYFSEFLKNMKQEESKEDSPELKAHIADQAFSIWLEKYKKGEFVPAFIIKKIVKLNLF